MLSFSNYRVWTSILEELCKFNPICKTNNSFINIFSDTKELCLKNYSYKKNENIYENWKNE